MRKYHGGTAWCEQNRQAALGSLLKIIKYCTSVAQLLNVWLLMLLALYACCLLGIFI